MACEGDHFSSLLCIRREGVRQFLSELSSPAAATGLKAEFVAKLVTNDDVQFYWSIATAAFDVDDTEVHETVLRKITELYITIRGFAYASAWIEQYKQTQKINTAVKEFA